MFLQTKILITPQSGLLSFHQCTAPLIIEFRAFSKNGKWRTGPGDEGVLGVSEAGATAAAAVMAGRRSQTVHEVRKLVKR